MEKVNGRRQFVKGIGFFAALLGGGAAAAAANTVPVVVSSSTNDRVLAPVSEPVVEDITHLAPPEGATTIQITGAYGEKPDPQLLKNSFGDSYYLNGVNLETTHRATMAVGMDNRLWIKVGEEWKRVALEA